ncbi:hypothetical protein ACLMJK_006751 [Lecanora helva]
MYSFTTTFLLVTLSVILSSVQARVARPAPVCHRDNQLRALERFPNFANHFCPAFLAKTGKYPRWLDHWNKREVSSACSCYEKTLTTHATSLAISTSGTGFLSSTAPVALSSVFATATASESSFPSITGLGSSGILPSATGSASSGLLLSGTFSKGIFPSGTAAGSTGSLPSSLPSVPNRGVSSLSSTTVSASVLTSAISSASSSLSEGASSVASATEPSGTNSLPAGDNYPPQPPGAGPGKRGLVYNPNTLNGWSTLFKSSEYVTYGSNGGWNRGTQLDESFRYVPTLTVDSSINNDGWNSAVPVLIEGGTKALFSTVNIEGSNLTAAEAATMHQKYMQPYAGTVQLGTPSITNEGEVGLAYLESFVTSCTSCTFNFVDVRFYLDRSTTTVTAFAQQLHDFIENDVYAVQAKHPQLKDLPIFISGWWLNGVSLDEGGELMETLLPYLDNNANILAYQASAGLLKGGLINDLENGLTPAGQAYMNYTADVASFLG